MVRQSRVEVKRYRGCIRHGTTRQVSVIQVVWIEYGVVAAVVTGLIVSVTVVTWSQRVVISEPWWLVKSIHEVVRRMVVTWQLLGCRCLLRFVHLSLLSVLH